MRCIIIDDDELMCRVLEDYVQRTDFLELSQSFTNAIDAINFINRGNDIQLIFLDIEMPEMNGIEFLKALTQKPQVIIVSSREKYALESYEYSVTDYLLKPVTYARFYKAVNKAHENFAKQSKVKKVDEFYIKQGSSLVKLLFEDVLWIEALENYVVINTKNDKFTIHYTMKAIENQLPSIFSRIHRSYIVNVKEIVSIDDNSVLVRVLDGKKNIPIGKSYREKLLQEINLMNK